MSQYYPQQPGYYPPPTQPESNEEEYEEYELDENAGGGGDSWPLRCGIFVMGGCVTFIALTACMVLSAGLWWLDPGSSLFAYENSDIGLAFDKPAPMKQEVVNDQGMQLRLVEVNRNAASNTIPAQDGVELIIVTVELTNLNSEDIGYDDEKQFKLLSPSQTPDELNEFPATPGAIDGSLGFGTLAAEEATQGRLVFKVVANTPNLVLEWAVGDKESTPRYIELR